MSEEQREKLLDYISGLKDLLQKKVTIGSILAAASLEEEVKQVFTENGGQFLESDNWLHSLNEQLKKNKHIMLKVKDWNPLFLNFLYSLSRSELTLPSGASPINNKVVLILLMQPETLELLPTSEDIIPSVCRL